MNIYFDMHTHTVASGHAFSTFKENVEEAAGKGLFALGMSDHAPAMPGSAPSIYFSNFKCFRQEVMGVRIFTGVEANIMDFNGNLDHGRAGDLKRRRVRNKERSSKNAGKTRD